MRVGVIGSRGIPASYSGFETFVEQLSVRLAERGHDVTVYCRTHHFQDRPAEYRGVRLVHLPAIRTKYLETLSHSTLSTAHALVRRYDVLLYVIAGNSVVTWIPRVFGIPTILNVDGSDWRRDKWPGWAKLYLKFAEWLARAAPTAAVTDSRAVREELVARGFDDLAYIPYGSEVEPAEPGEFLREYGLEPQKYVLFVGRLVPENRVEHVVEAFRSLSTDYRCVIVGGSAYADAYIASLREAAAGDPRIVFTGYVFGDGYRELSTHAAVFVESSAVGGTHPALVEAMAFGSCVIVNDTPANLEVIGDAGLAYDGRVGAAALAGVMGAVLEDPARRAELQRKARERARRQYGWEAVTSEYEGLMVSLVAGDGAAD